MPEQDGVQVFRDTRRLAVFTAQMIFCMGLCAVIATLAIVGQSDAENSAGLSFADRFVAISLAAAALAVLVVLMRGGRRSRLVIGPVTVEVANPAGTFVIPTEDVRDFVPGRRRRRHIQSVLLRLHSGRLVGVFAVGRYKEQALADALERLNRVLANQQRKAASPSS